MEPEKQRSLFYRRMKNSQLAAISACPLDLVESNKLTNSNGSSSIDLSAFGNRSYIVTGSEADQIHVQNIETLAKMSIPEIEESRKTLLDMISPSHLEFIRNRRKTLEMADKEDALAKCIEGLEIDNKSASASIISPLLNKGLHMDIVEPEKMKWMEDVPNITVPFPGSLCEARFNFKGEHVSYVDDNSDHANGLYHHGNEPHRPGYTVEELFMLIRSALPAQRVLGLNTLAAILEKQWIYNVCGAEDSEQPIIKVLLDNGLFLLLRFALDDKLRSVYVASLRAIAALLWNKIDMTYLANMDGVFGDLKKPTFEVRENALNCDKEIYDDVLLNTDLIRGILRTDILLRFRYLLCDPKIEETDLLRILKCLTRIAYHSAECSLEVFNSPSIIEQLLQYNTSSKCVNIQYSIDLLGFLRLLSTRSVKIASTLITKYNIVPYLLETMSCSWETSMHLITECICMWNLLFTYNLCPEAISCVCPLVFRLLRSSMFDALDIFPITFVCLSSLITLVKLLFNDIGASTYELVCNNFALHWLQYICIHKPLRAEKFLTNLTNFILFLDQYTLDKAIEIFTNYMQDVELDIIKCSFFINFRQLCNIENYPSLHIPPEILCAENHMLVLHSYLLLCQNMPYHDDLMQIMNPIIMPYLKKLFKCTKLYDNARQWPARFEVHFLHNILIITGKYLPPGICVQLGFTLATIIQKDDAHLMDWTFRNVIFRMELFGSSKILHEKLQNGEQKICSLIFSIIDNLPEIQLYYINTLLLTINRKPNVPNLMTTRENTDTVLPFDWYYSPITKMQDMNGSEQGSFVNIEPALKYIFLLECLFPHILDAISLSTRYCRLASIFFNENVFHGLENILQNNLRILLNRNKDLEFNKPILGIKSFYDFYRDLCRQFCDVGYCNQVFGMFLLVPLQQKYSVEYRKLIWSEEATMLRLLNVPIEELLVPLCNYLEPCETDVVLLDMYLYNLATGKVTTRWSPVLYAVALHHVSSFIVKPENADNSLYQKVMALKNTNLRSDILSYRCVPEMSA